MTGRVRGVSRGQIRSLYWPLKRVELMCGVLAGAPGPDKLFQKERPTAVQRRKHVPVVGSRRWSGVEAGARWQVTVEPLGEMVA